jgi:ubiquinone/menaquinone biosynthesis C-methylase UbiE
MGQVNLGHYVVGTKGLALLRTWLVGARADADRRLAELSAFLVARDGSPLATELDAPATSVTDGYGRWAATYDATPNPLIRLEEPVVRALVAELPPGDALDAACGTGRHAAFLAARGHRVVGIDATAAMLAVARAAVPRGDFRLGDLGRLPADPASADLVLCTLALTHVADLGPPIAELARVARPGARVVVSDFAPIMCALGGTALFVDAHGRAGYVESYTHTHAAYLRAFRIAGLDVIDCIEPPLGDEEVFLLSGGLSDLAPEAFRAAWGGLPGALVWALRRR